ncbi:SDR family NAD(P)-dependent oxidoreductase [Congregibacter brevis]|uniref:SDR family NAD(P)-dependent oxidoreductase n=1 Tax=Congregibacter brevis TaxID=3081201 RepID=A0ABZ0ID56_9GAMM|nr:SDR family NAD(P)-dependent oxidoreductase [Congregibacter sp. IMCC45268]
MLELENKTVVITGGATGIGFALAKACGREKANIVIGGPNPDRLDEATAELEQSGIAARSLPCDVRDFAQVEAFADFAFGAFGEVALVLNNAGIAQAPGPVAATPLNEVRQVFDVNFYGVWHCCKAFTQRLADQGRPAAIYNTGSENSYFVAVVKSAAYVASKHAVYGLTDALREEVPEFIHVGLITPGFVGTEIVPEGARKLGMPVDDFAQRALPQIKAGTFYVVSHSYNQEHIDRRYEEVSNAFASYAPREDGDDQYDVRTLLRRLSSN